LILQLSAEFRKNIEFYVLTTVVVKVTDVTACSLVEYTDGLIKVADVTACSLVEYTDG
jgi:hypothetical protein